MSRVIDFFLGFLAAFLAPVALYFIPRGRQFVQRVYGIKHQIAGVLIEGGISRMTLSREDYYKYRSSGGALRNYLELAERCIEVVSISLNVTQAEGALIALFEHRIRSNPSFRVRITLLNPDCVITAHLAKSLDIEPRELQDEIRGMLDQLVACRNRFRNESERERLQIYVHDTLPIGSAILLDATPTSGRIQVETKLYRAPRVESFGFEVVAPSSFYERNFIAWQKVFEDSRPWPLNEAPHFPSRRN